MATSYMYMSGYDNYRFPSKNFSHVSTGLSAVSSTSLEDLNVAEESMKWSAKRNHNFSYKVPDDHFTTPIEVEMDVSNTKKRLIYAISDLHLGGSWAMGMEDKLGAYLDDLIGKSRDQVSVKTVCRLARYTWKVVKICLLLP